ncbi:MAG: TonB family protein [Deltaproteobacteria bacterium]|nr:TonB family protein [Deltaproteobacteria bacterium]MCB9478478.1 TonB family protein [Deltaproteobacteria bacterium]
MSDRWREDLRTWQQRRLIAWAVVVSILAHIFVIAMFLALPEARRTVPAKDEDVVWLDPGDFAPPPPKDNAPLLTRPPKMPDAEEKTPEKADFKSDKDRSVAQTTHNASKPINDNENPVGPKGPPARPKRSYAMPSVGEGMQRSDKPRDKPVESEDAGPAGAGQVSTTDLVKGSGFATRPEAGSGGGGNTSDFNPRVGAAGDALSINTKDLKYIGYFAGVKEKIEWAWVYPQEASQRGQQGRLTLSFTILRSGKLKEVKQLSGSGFAILDQAAVRAVRDAAAFAPFPPDWPDEEITIVANFQYTLRSTNIF